jgi:hypothetical protein
MRLAKPLFPLTRRIRRATRPGSRRRLPSQYYYRSRLLSIEANPTICSVFNPLGNFFEKPDFGMGVCLAPIPSSVIYCTGSTDSAYPLDYSAELGFDTDALVSLICGTILVLVRPLAEENNWFLINSRLVHYLSLFLPSTYFCHDPAQICRSWTSL